jgi:hypothetical protein
VTPDLAASFYARLSARAKEHGEDFQQVLTRYGVERFLYRLSLTPVREKLWLKGALLFDLWFDVAHRLIRDADFLGFGPADAAALTSAIRDACAVEAAGGMAYDPASVKVREIREEARYGGLRVTLQGRLRNARCPVQLDVGCGDAATPGPEEAVYPTLFDDLPAPRLSVYPRETVVAEKLEAIASLGMTNSRMKDYFDLRALAHEAAVDPDMLAAAIAATFARRGTALPAGLPLGLADEFARDRLKPSQWKAFLSKNRLEAPPLDEVGSEVRSFLEAPLGRTSRQRA